MKSLLGLITFICFFTAIVAQKSPRTHEKFDQNWKYAFGHASQPEKDFNYGIETVYSKSGGAQNTAIDPRFNDSLWRNLDLPHDWAVELPFVNDEAFNVMAHGYKPVGGKFPATSIGWYRKHFTIDSTYAGKRLSITFDGIFRDAKCWINGFYLGNNESGYVGASFDITDFVQFDKDNVIVVRVDATQYEGWFYEGAGIYRHVWLDSYENAHIVQDGIFAYTSFAKNNTSIHIEANVVNESSKNENLRIETKILDRGGKVVALAKNAVGDLTPEQQNIFTQQVEVKNPRFWSLEDPYLYRIQVSVYSGNKLVDQQLLRYGIRKIEVKTNGLFLNDKKVKIKGVNCHQDHAGVGSALPDYLQYYRIRLLKNMGVNAYRTSHHAPTPELLDACDSLGMLVMDEQRLLNSGKEYMDQFYRLVKRDRSRTSVFMWCIGNEEGWIHTTDTGKKIAQTFGQKLHILDPTRTYTYAADVPNVYKGVNEVMPVRSFNYRQFAVADYHKDHPDQPIIGTEMGSTVTTRGELTKDTIQGYVPDQDITAPWWASTAETWWKLAAENDFWLGGFIWTGFDYRGEPTPFEWPNINSHFGIMDMCGFPKNLYYYYQSWWTDKDVLHISPHWNHRDKRGENIEVWVNSNADDVELFLNGKSLGKKIMPRNGHLKWMITYEPGTLEAIANKKGRVLKEKIETTDTPSEVVLTPYKTTMLADGSDATVINVSVVDRMGRTVPNANHQINFEISGPGKIIGVGNGDPSSHEPDKCTDGAWKRNLFNGYCQVIVQSTSTSGIIKFDATSPNLWKGSTDIITVAPTEVAKITIDPAYILKGNEALPRKVDKMIGADISHLPELEARGITFKDGEKPGDAIEILKHHGINYVRLRIFNDPASEGGYSPEKGFCDLAHTVEMAKRVKKAGMGLLLDFHYSDYWADPGKQYKPKAWEGLSFTALKKALYDYTKSVITTLKENGVTPDMVQIGNEINHGIVWPEGSVAHPDQLAQLLCAGTAAVKSVSPETQMMLHVALGGQNEESVAFIDQMIARSVHFDVIGLSYYPKWHGTLDDLHHNMNDLIRRYDKDIIVVEYSSKKDEVHKTVFELPGDHGKGTCIWEPLNTWESVFDRNGQANELLKKYDNYKAIYLMEKK
jgi:beta-galactosidase